MPENVILFLQDKINFDAGVTLKDLQHLVYETFNITCCKTTIENYIKGFNYSVKRTSILPVRRNDINAINLRE